MEGIAMPTTKNTNRKLPGAFDALVKEMPPRAITDDTHYENTTEMIDRLMASGKLTKGQEAYLETLVQLVQVYEANHHAIDTVDLSGIDALRHLLSQNDMNASDLARLLGVHLSMGSKILKGERSLTVDHLRKLADRFKVRPDLFMA
jgi:HTH-type transcriptional regulator/antitoxin HigA